MTHLITVIFTLLAGLFGFTFLLQEGFGIIFAISGGFLIMGLILAVAFWLDKLMVESRDHKYL